MLDGWVANFLVTQIEEGMLVAKVAIIIGISIVTLLIAIALDTVLSPLPLLVQFLIQIPVLVLSIEAVQQFTETYILPKTGLQKQDVDTLFLFVAPLAALGSVSLFAELRRTFHL
jgi:hypothetical protein